jgi:high-affinity nickel permease
MLGAYGWAYRNPVRKLFYNLTIASVSVLVALGVGGVETLGLIAGRFQLHGAFWNAISDLNDNFGTLGYGIVALFIVSWGCRSSSIASSDTTSTRERIPYDPQYLTALQSSGFGAGSIPS